MERWMGGWKVEGWKDGGWRWWWKVFLFHEALSTQQVQRCRIRSCEHINLCLAALTEGTFRFFGKERVPMEHVARPAPLT